MAIDEQVTLLKSGPADWNRWRAANPRTIPNLRGANLIEAVLLGSDLNSADLREAHLEMANLEGVQLFRADLEKADLRGARLTGANLRGANLLNADLTGANLTKADMRGVDLEAAILSETILGDTDLRHGRNLDHCSHIGPSVIDHRTIQRSITLPLAFLRGCGPPDVVIDYLPTLLNSPIQYYSCFISYTHKDQLFARRLFDALQGRGIRCWLDEKQMLPGDDMYEQIDRGIRLWDKLLLCCSENSLTSWWVDNEIDTAFEKERRLMADRGRKVLVLIPLDLDGALLGGDWQGGKARQLLSRVVANFKGWDASNAHFELELDRVVAALRADDGARSSPPTPKI